MAWRVSIAAAMVMMVSYVDRTTLAFLAPSVTKALGISNEAYGWLGSAFSMAYLFATPLCGWWIDRIGARRGLIASVVAWSAVAALHAIVPGFATLFLLRLALGITEGPAFPGAAQVIQRVLPPGDRARGFGVLFTGSSIGATLVPPFATLVLHYAGWRGAFLVTSLAGLLWIPLWLSITRSQATREQLDTVPATEPSATRPAFFEVLSSPIMLRALCAIFAAAPVFGFPQVWAAKYLTSTFHLGQGDIGLYVAIGPLMFDAGALLFGDLGSRQRRAPGSPPRALFGAGLVLALATGALSLAATPWQATFITGIALIGSAGMYTLATADMLARMPANAVSLAGGIMAGAQSLAFIIGNPLIGRAVDSMGNYRAVSIGVACWAIPGSLIWLLWRPPARFVSRRETEAALPRATVR
jgi:ACS family hexuronate transporter-like MFS transporter